MARRSALLIAAVIIAALGTAMILLYVKGIDDRATQGQELVEVLTATETIEAGETVAAAQEAGKFDTKEVRRDDVVSGALDSTESINDLVATRHRSIPGEQIIPDRFGTLGDVEQPGDPRRPDGDVGGAHRLRAGRRLRQPRLGGRHLRHRGHADPPAPRRDRADAAVGHPDHPGSGPGGRRRHHLRRLAHRPRPRRASR